MKEQLKRASGGVWFCLRVAAALCLFTVFLIAQSGGITTKDQKAKETIDAAFKALGGADKVGGIKSLVLKGTETTAPNGEILIGGIPIGVSPAREFEIRILLPDSFIRIYRSPTTYSGVSRGTLIPPMNFNDESLINYSTNNRVDEWSRFLIGTLLMAGSTPIMLSSSSTSGVFTLTKKEGTLGEIEFDSKTGYPSAIRYKIENTLPTGAKLVGGLGFEETSHREIRFEDRFSSNGIMFPNVITTTEPTTITELRIEEVLINPTLSLKDFELPGNTKPQTPKKK